MKTYILDASALICFLSAEPGHRRVADILKQAAVQRCSVRMSVVNWGEVIYKIWARDGETAARAIRDAIDRLNCYLEPVSLEDAFSSAEMKALHHLQYADAFAAALALRTRGILVTTDEHFRRLGKRISILWLR